MKKAKRILTGLFALILAAAALFITACGEEAPEFKNQTIADFTNGAQTDVFFASDGWCNGGVFDVEWDESAVTYSDGAANLTVKRKPDGESGADADVDYY